MLNFIVDTSKQGLSKVLRKYQELALRYLWEIGDQGANSRMVHYAVNVELPLDEKISRASIIARDSRNWARAGWLAASALAGRSRIGAGALDNSMSAAKN